MNREHTKYDVITLDGTYVTTINKRLVEKQKINDEQLEVIKALHVERFEEESLMETAKEDDLKAIAKYLVGVDRQLQIAWGFEYNPNMYRFWDVPKCCCPSIDNNDAWPSGYYSVNLACPVHG